MGAAFRFGAAALPAPEEADWPEAAAAFATISRPRAEGEAGTGGEGGSRRGGGGRWRTRRARRRRGGGGRRTPPPGPPSSLPSWPSSPSIIPPLLPVLPSSSFPPPPPPPLVYLSLGLSPAPMIHNRRATRGAPDGP
eukprot:3572968-Pyramimonas_sp.AAC.1